MTQFVLSYFYYCTLICSVAQKVEYFFYEDGDSTFLFQIKVMLCYQVIIKITTQGSLVRLGI